MPAKRTWLERQRQDPYVRAAKRQGLRSRAVFKLEELDARFKLLRPGLRVVELGAAPGSWSRYAAPRIAPAGRLIAVDVLPMKPIPGAEVIQAEFPEPAGAQVLAALKGQSAGLVLSDLAPNLTGIAAVDQARCSALNEAVLTFCAGCLVSGGSLLMKLFAGSALNEVQAACAARFSEVRLVKPAASRARSKELFILARDLR